MDPYAEPTIEQVNSFLQTEFLFYLIPCYYGVVAMLYRYYALLQTQPSYYVSHIPGESFIRNFQPQEERCRNSQALSYRILTASYVIKSKLCLFNSYLYLFMVFLSFICTSSMFYSANHRLHSFLYLFGALAWYAAALVLRKQQQRGLAQSIWIHRLFWILAGTFSVYKMFEDYFLPLNLILNICLIISNLILALYGIYRAEDTDTLIMVTSDDLPGFVKVAFQKIQLNERIRALFKIEDQTNENLADETNIIHPQIGDQDLQIIGKVLKRSAESIKTQINLLNELPRRNVFVDKKVRYVRVGQKFKSCYFILTQVGNSRFEVQRSVEQFRALYQILGQIFTPQNFPKHQLPRPIGLLGGDAEGNLSDNLETWFEQVLKTPIFITKQVLQFLNIDTQKSAPFITYFQNSYSSFCSRHFILLKHNKNKLNQTPQKQKKQAGQLAGYYNREIRTKEATENQKLLQLLKSQLSFTVSLQNLLEEQDGIKLIITCIIDKKKRLTWDLKKRVAGLSILNRKVQQECNCLVPFFYSLIGSTPTKHKTKLNQNCKVYLQTLLNHKKYYCPILFTYIRFDIVKQQVVATEGVPITLQPLHVQERKSRYFQEYEDKGGFIEVLRVDRLQTNGTNEELFKFKVRRKQLTLSNKTSNELTLFRQKLASYYKGVSFVPEIKFKNNSKAEAKNKIEAFLLKIQNLPKIEILREYRQFYGNSLQRE